jgi:hypothetical protein
MDGYEDELRTDTIPESSSETSTTEVNSDCSGGLVWAILFIIAALAIVGLVFWIIWLYYNRTCDKLNCCNGSNGNCNNSNNKLSVTGVNIQVTSDTQVTASWTGVTGNTGTVFTLYATLNPPNIDNNGNVSNSNIHNTATSNQTSVSLSGLQARLKYYITLVATNPSSINYFVYTQIVYMQSSNISQFVTNTSGTNVVNTFGIDDILQVGKIQVVDSSGVNGVYTVQFNQNPVNANSLWFVNSRNQIQSSNNSLDTPNGLCLYNNNGTLNGQDCLTPPNIDASTASQNSTWTYNPTGFTNQWCLTNTVSPAGAPNTNKPVCMVLGPISSQGIATVSVNNNATAGDAWAIAYQTNT